MTKSVPPERSFFHPHNPEDTAFKNELTNPWTGEVTTPPSMTKQEFVAECEINNILAEFKVTGQIRHLAPNLAAGIYADLSNAPDFQEALNIVIRGEEAFATLPSSLRARFNNDPAQFLEFMGDPANQDEAIKLGLAVDNRPERIIEPTGPTGGDGGTPPSEPPKAA